MYQIPLKFQSSEYQFHNSIINNCQDLGLLHSHRLIDRTSYQVVISPVPDYNVRNSSQVQRESLPGLNCVTNSNQVVGSQMLKWWNLDILS